MSESKHYPVDYDNEQPICDICDQPQCAEPTCPFFEWNGETGNHVVCEEQSQGKED